MARIATGVAGRRNAKGDWPFTFVFEQAFCSRKPIPSLAVEMSAMEFTADHRRWAKNRQRMYGRTQAYYLDLIASQAGLCAFSSVPLRFDAMSGTPVAGGVGCHPLYAALDHTAPGSDHEGHRVVSYALNDLKGHLPYDCFLALAQTPAWLRLMELWRAQTSEDADDREGFYALLRQRDPAEPDVAHFVTISSVSNCCTMPSRRP